MKLDSNIYEVKSLSLTRMILPKSLSHTRMVLPIYLILELVPLKNFKTIFAHP